MSLERAPFIVRVGANDSTAQLRTGIMSSCMLDGQAPQKGTRKFFVQHLRLQKKATDTDTVPRKLYQDVPSILINFNHVGNFCNPDISRYHIDAFSIFRPIHQGVVRRSPKTSECARARSLCTPLSWPGPC